MRLNIMSIFLSVACLFFISQKNGNSVFETLAVVSLMASLICLIAAVGKNERS